jgi:aspartyl-tRNA(Asn)/glutamyl-tRNA(Gln) amidotransferase subunit B
MIALIDRGTISGKIAKDVLAEMFKTGASPARVVEEKGLVQISDTGALEEAVRAVLEAHPDQVAQYRAGNEKVLGFFVGQVMRATRGKANPHMVNELLGRLLEEA